MSRFTTFWVWHTISQFGDRITELALPLIAVTVLAATPTEVGLLTAAVWAPTLLVATAGGLLACLWLLPSSIPRMRSIEDGTAAEVDHRAGDGAAPAGRQERRRVADFVESR